MKPARVRFYVDADVLGLAKTLAAINPEITYPGDPGARFRGRVRPACVVTSPATKDDVWVPEVAQRAWLIITRDNHMKDHRREIAAVVDNAARMVALAGADAKRTWDQLEIVMRHWRRIDALTAVPGPFIYSATLSGLRKLV